MSRKTLKQLGYCLSFVALVCVYLLVGGRIVFYLCIASLVALLYSLVEDML